MPSEWAAPPEGLLLLPDHVHVWRVTSRQPDTVVAWLRSLLASDEQQRADRFHFEKDRRQFIVARGVLRTLLAGYLNIEPGQIRFCYSRYGKPQLDGDDPNNLLRFNLSHSHGLALMAFALNRELGIDVEWLRADLACDDIAKRFFSPAEQAALRALPAAQRLQGFFNCWTRKEAYIKAIGTGLSMPLDQFDVSLAPGEPARLLAVRSQPSQMQRWSLEALDLGPDFAAAVAVEGHGWQLRCWQWRPHCHWVQRG
ncbi:MAG: 4'-phosphopantetheinyl transferase superfamily protein [Acidobacteriota bacterium]|nr:4'-phosphopantetheinyl transferase superfamily protein [Blastocatellia bacterium]MDW8240061.1 4'-phosphopantetheinyl transferase superfamily protein [Acidobacteriota bacterium]